VLTSCVCYNVLQCVAVCCAAVCCRKDGVPPKNREIELWPGTNLSIVIIVVLVGSRSTVEITEYKFVSLL